MHLGLRKESLKFGQLLLDLKKYYIKLAKKNNTKRTIIAAYKMSENKKSKIA